MTQIYNLPIQFNIPKVVFRSNGSSIPVTAGAPVKDGFVSNPLYDNFGNKAQIEAEAKANPRIAEIMNEYNLPIKVNMEELKKLQQGHLADTRVMVAKMYSALPDELKQEVNLKQLQEAAMFHDYGKIMIPEKILNKAGELNVDEREIMRLHSELGYELLKNKNLDENTLNLIKYHHQTKTGEGYPAIDSGYEYTLESQMLNTADKYSALREERSYKKALSKAEALEIILQEVQAGIISPEVYEALVKAV